MACAASSMPRSHEMSGGSLLWLSGMPSLGLFFSFFFSPPSLEGFFPAWLRMIACAAAVRPVSRHGSSRRDSQTAINRPTGVAALIDRRQSVSHGRFSQDGGGGDRFFFLLNWYLCPLANLGLCNGPG